MLTNSQLKHFQSLKLKKYRQNYAEFLVEGHKLVTEALLEMAPVQHIIATPAWIDAHQHTVFNSVSILAASEKELAKISTLTTPPPVMAVLKIREISVESIDFRHQWSLVLDGISDPGNLGTIIRSADWFGVRNIVCSEQCVELYNPKVIQSTMGSLFRMKVIYTSLPEFLAEQTMPKYAATLNGENIHTVHWEKEGFIVTGSESHGISEEVLAVCDKQITIPGPGNAESLNAAVATSIILSKLSSLQ